MLRLTKIGLIITVALWGFVGALHNVVNWSGTVDAVRAASSMTTFDGGADSWQATSSPVVAWLGALFICGSKLLVGLLCSAGAMAMFRARSDSTAAFALAKQTALAGCAVAVFMLFGGFIVVAESWFELWRSDDMRGPVLGSAFRYAGMIALIGIFVGTRDD